MSTLFTINACKTFGCRNLGLASSEDYSWPDYKLGYPALHCRACGSYPPLFDEQQFRDWLSVHLSTYAIEKGHFCPVCYGTDMICYGHNPRVRNAFNAVTAKKSGRLKNIRKKLRIPRPLKPFNCSYPFKGPAQYKNCMF